MIAEYIHFEFSFDEDIEDRNQIYYSFIRWESSEGEF